jgi:hypothetical protein
VAKRRKIMGDQYCIVQINMFRKTSPEVLTLLGILKVGVTKYQFLQQKMVGSANATGRRTC